MLKKSISLSFVLLLGIQLVTFAQQVRRPIEYSGFFDSYYYRGPFNITVGGNTSAYIGDLGFAPEMKLAPGFHLGGSYQVWPRTYFGLDLNYYSFGGEKSDTSGKISFNTTIFETVAFCRFNLIDKRILFKNDINKRPPRVRPYITLGVGGIYYDPKVTVTDTNFTKNYEVVKTNNIALVLPASLGFAFYINKRFSILADFGYRFLFTDALDGINKLNTSGKDSYVTAALKLQYTFHPLKRRKAKYIPPTENYSGAGAGSGPKAPKDSTLNEPILPPGAPIPPPGADSTAAPAGGGTGDNQGLTPPADEKPKELTEEEKRKKQEEEEQKAWEESAAPKPKATTPAAKKKTTAQPKPEPKKEDTGGW